MPYTLVVSEEEVQRYRLMAARAAVEEAELWARAGIVPQAEVADVGCGPAATTLEMARVVGPAGRVVGVEREEAALGVARQLVAAAGADNVELRQGEAAATGLPQGSVDVAVLRHVLAHNGGREREVVAHLAALVRPGGCVYLVDVDLTAIRVLGTEPALEELAQRYVELHRRLGNDPLVGLRLSSLLEAAGLVPVVHQGSYGVVQLPPGVRPPAWAAREAMVEHGVATAGDLRRWAEALARSDAAARRPTAFVPQFVAFGRRPS